MAVFANCEKSAFESWLAVLTTIGEFDPDEIVKGNLRVVKEYRLKMKKMPILEALEGLHSRLVIGAGLGSSQITGLTLPPWLTIENQMLEDVYM
jgi:hypothetical protein